MKKRNRLLLMIIALGAVLVFMLTVRQLMKPEEVGTERPEFLLVIHGGAGEITRDKLPDSLAAEYYNELRAALVVGYRILDTGGSALDAVEAVVRYMEDCPLFNAGKGAVFTADGKNELDASIMDGASGQAGAVAGVTTVKNPVTAARAVMERTPHVMLAGKGADLFAAEQNLDIVDSSWFFTEDRYKSWLTAVQKLSKKGTVGAVALDKDGNLAAATSTGGMSMKRYGRIGDAPVIGAGTYADNNSCAVSCTGHGEFFIRNAVAYDMAAKMLYQNITVEQAAHEILHEKLKNQGGTGGIIAIDKSGNYTMDFNTSGMFRGVIYHDGTSKVLIFNDEE